MNGAPGMKTGINVRRIVTYAMLNPNLFGVLNIYKPAGVTSRDVVNSIQRLIRPVKCGHAGTLDPMATGVLLIGIGPATRLTTMLQEREKTYVAEFILGQTSDTDDNTGQVQQRPEPAKLPTIEDIDFQLQSMTGIVSQIPPIFSAVHVAGQRAYDLARRGEDVQLAARTVEIHSIRLLSYAWPKLELEICCGSGTYIRSIARDLGVQLGCGGLMSRLERTQIGNFHASSAIPAAELTLESFQVNLCPAVLIVQHLPQYDCSPDDVVNLLCGRVLTIDDSRLKSSGAITAGAQFALTRDNFGELISLAIVTSDLRLQPRTVFIRREEN